VMGYQLSAISFGSLTTSDSRLTTPPDASIRRHILLNDTGEEDADP
jgi:hypothetical protein